jgi:hypothetical protein
MEDAACRGLRYGRHHAGDRLHAGGVLADAGIASKGRSLGMQRIVEYSLERPVFHDLSAYMIATLSAVLATMPGRG